VSERKEQAIYDAVHEPLMKLRVRARRVMNSTGWTPDELDLQIAQAQHAAGMAAIAAYRKPLKRKRKGSTV
jgi:hypothetical protein